MDRHIHWLREFVIRTVLVRVVAVCVIGAIVIQVFVTFTMSHELSKSLPWSILAGQGAALLFAATAVMTNPLNRRYLRSYMEAPIHLVASVGPDDMHENASTLLLFQLRPVVVVSDPADDASLVFDLLQSENRLVTAAVNRTTGSVALMSRLSDGRILHTTDLAMPPCESLVLNTHREAGPAELVSAHRAMMVRLGGHGLGSAPSGATLFAAVMAAEHAAYAELGPIVGSFLNLDSSPSYHRLLVRLDPARLLDLSMQSTPEPPTVVGRAPTSSRANANTVPTPALATH